MCHRVEQPSLRSFLEHSQHLKKDPHPLRSPRASSTRPLPAASGGPSCAWLPALTSGLGVRACRGGCRGSTPSGPSAARFPPSADRRWAVPAAGRCEHVRPRVCAPGTGVLRAIVWGAAPCFLPGCWCLIPLPGHPHPESWRGCPPIPSAPGMGWEPPVWEPSWGPLWSLGVAHCPTPVPGSGPQPSLLPWPPICACRDPHQKTGPPTSPGRAAGLGCVFRDPGVRGNSSSVFSGPPCSPVIIMGPALHAHLQPSVTTGGPAPLPGCSHPLNPSSSSV